MATVIEVMAKLSGNASGMVRSFTEAARSAENEMRRVRTAASNAVDSNEVGARATDAGRRAGGGFKGAFGGAVAGLGVIVAAAGLGGLVTEAMAASDATDKFKATMNFAGLDTSAIDKASKAAKAYADQTVYDLPTIQNMMAQLASNGIKDYTGLTTAAGNLNAVAGGNAETFKSVAMTMTQTAGAGKLTTENWNQLADAIPGAAGPLMKALEGAGAYTGNFRTAMEKGQITADEFNAALMTLGTKPVAVEAAKSTATFEGAIGGLMATINSKLMTALDAIKPAATTAITFLATGLGTAFDVVGAAVGNVASFVTTDLVPALTNMWTWTQQNSTTLGIIAAVIGTILLPSLIRVGVAATVSAAQQVIAWATSGAGAVKTGVMYVATSWMIVGSWIRQGAAAVASGATTVAIWGLYAIEAVKGAAAMAVNAARVVAGWVLMGVQSMIHAARMAAAWFIALGPVGWVIAAVIGLVAIIIANWDAIASWTATAWQAVVGFVVAAWEAIVSWVTTAVTAVVTPIVDGFNAMLSFITTIFTNISTFISGVWTWVFNLLTSIGQAFWAEHGAQLTAAWNFIVSIFTTIFEFYVSIWTAIITFVIEVVTNIVNGIVTGFTNAYNGIVAALQAAWDFISSIWSTVVGFLSGVMTTIGSVISAAWNLYVSIITTVVMAIWGVVVDVFNQVWGFISSIFATISGYISGVWNTIYGAVSAAVSNVLSAVSSGFGAVWSVAVGIFNNIVGYLGGVWANIVSGVSGMVGQVGSWFRSVWTTVTGIFAGAGTWLWNAGRNIVDGLINGVKSLAGTIGNAFLSMIPGWIVGPFKAALGIASPSKLFTQFGKWIIQGLGRGVDSEEKTAVGAITNVAKSVEKAGSSMTIAAPRFETPRVPKIDTSSLAVDPITVSVMLDASAFEKTAKGLSVGQVDGGLKLDASAPLSPMARGYGGDQPAPVQQHFQITNYNPVAEPTSKTVEKAQNAAALAGVF